MIFSLENILIYSTLFFSLFLSLFFLTVYLEENEPTSKKRCKKYPKISIVIPAYNEGKNIIDSIKSVLRVDYPKDKAEIIVVDDGSQDDTFIQAKKMDRKNVRVFTKKHSGKASTVNYGIKKSTGEIIMVLDADTFPDKKCLKNIVGYFDNPKVMAALPIIKISRLKSLVEKCQMMEYSIMAIVKKAFFLMGSMNCTPAGALIRKKFIKKYGGFDTDTLTEDFEMGLRIQSKNYQIAQSLESQVYTIVPNNIKMLLRQRIRWNYGTLKNIFKYRFMISYEYGDLGLFILPISIFSVSLISFMFIYFLIKTVIDTVHQIYLASLIGFDLKHLLNFNAKISLINMLTSEKNFFILFTILAGFIIYEAGRRSINEKFRWEYILYLLFYGWILGLSQLISLVYFIIGKKPEW